VTAAIFGLVGVVIGATLSGGIEYLARRREERATARALARAIHAHLMEMQSQCSYCLERSNWTLMDTPFVLPEIWRENELVLARLLTWKQWVTLQAIRTGQQAVRMLAEQAESDAPMNETHLPTVTSVAIETIDSILPDFVRLSGQT
jgi:hypothetical protein